MASSPEPADPARLAEIRGRVGDALTLFLARQRAVLSGVGEDLLACLDVVDDLLAGGKRVRPAFCYWGFRAAGGLDAPEIFAAAAALELLHASALVHDDVIDDSDIRRGLPAVHRRFATWHRETGRAGSAERFGAGTAILVGDLLLSWANEVFASSGFAPDALARGAPIWTALQTELAAGQFLDLLSQVTSSTSVAEAIRVVTYKTTKYTTERPLQLGAALAAGPATGEASAIGGTLSRYAMPLGIAFQLRDDVLGVFGDPVRTGKPVGGDISEGKRTVLIALARTRASPGQAAVLDRHLGDRNLTAAGAAEVRAVVTATGALAECEDQIAAYRKQAVAALDDAPVPEDARSALTALAEIITDRDD